MEAARLSFRPLMHVPLVDLKAQHASLGGAIKDAISSVVDSGAFILGPDVRALESEIAQYCGTRHAVGCASGSDALLLSLMTLNLRSGDQVITSPYSFFATASAIVRVGAKPVFVDIDPLTLNIDPGQAEQAITDRTRAILPVHLFGQMADMNSLMRIGARHKLEVIEDAAQAIGSEDCEGRKAGSVGLAGCLSFYPSKNLGAGGDAGMITTNNGDFAARLRTLRVHGASTEYWHSDVGINSRLDSIQAALLRVKLPFLDRWADARNHIARRYALLFTQAGLEKCIQAPYSEPGAKHVFNLYVVRVNADYRDELLATLNRQGVGAKVYYPVPLHLQECFRYLGYQKGAFPESERAARETLALPNYPEITSAQQEYVVNVIRHFYEDQP